MVVDGKIAFVGGIDLSRGRWDTAQHPVVADPKVHVGVDFYNPEVAGERHYDRDLRMPWHDVHVSIKGPAVYDVENSFVQRWNFQRESHDNEAAVTLRATKPTGTETGGQKVQVVRSVSGNHIETKKTEQSIYLAYANAIKGAQHFIYIENQFFTSRFGNNDVKNKISDMLAERIVNAINDGEPFKVIIVLPVHPEGSVGSSSVKEVLHYQFQSLGQPPQFRRGQLKSTPGNERTACGSSE